MRELIAAARGKAPADLILANARIINVFNGKLETGNVAVINGKIAGIGDYREAKQTIDLGGLYLAPALINGHTHLESSMLDMGEYARAVVPHGTLAIITDLHEIANVSGLDGMRYILNYASRLPLDLFLMAPSCVPATHLETTGATISAREISQILKWQSCIGLGEVMNFPGVLGLGESILGKLRAASGRVVDGHAPGLRDKDLNAYISAGIYSDHESVSLAEASEKLARGMYIMVREGSSEKNLDSLLPLVNEYTYKRCFFVVDDRNCADLLHDGDIDAVVRKAISRGLEPIRAIQMATINPAEYFRLNRLGAIAPSYGANFIVLSDLSRFDIKMVFYQGNLVADEGKHLFALPQHRGRGLSDTVKIKPFTPDALRLSGQGLTRPVIEVIPGQIITRKVMAKLKITGGFIVSDTERDILKIAVVERHHATGNIGLGMVKGFGLHRGALASSIAHDSHNIVAVGVSDEDIFAAVREVERLGGGLVAAQGGKVLASLPLPVAGLLSNEPLPSVVAKLEQLERIARELGTTLPSPFATLSFLALPVIPELRLTDLGLVDVAEFKLI